MLKVFFDADNIGMITDMLDAEEHADGENVVIYNTYTISTPIESVIFDPVFGNYGRLIFPVDEWYYSGETLGSLYMTWYSHIDPDKTVEICNYLKTRAVNGERFVRSHLFLKMPWNWVSILRVIPYGEEVRVREWLPNLVRTGRRNTAAMIFRNLRRL